MTPPARQTQPVRRTRPARGARPSAQPQPAGRTLRPGRGICATGWAPAARAAFTLVELLVVISIIGLLTAMLLPSLTRARDMTRSAVCLSNLRQMVIAANTYAMAHQKHYPAGQFSRQIDGQSYFLSWDYIKTVTWTPSGAERQVRPGLLWMGQGNDKVQQCPVFEGPSNAEGDPYTGYNYNTSYIGRGQGEHVSTPARITDVRQPSRCAMFGDGQFAGGANKYMRSPELGPYDRTFAARWAGTQGYRHIGKTNVAWCDGSAGSWGECHDGGHGEHVAEGTGFLSPDDSLYDLE